MCEKNQWDFRYVIVVEEFCEYILIFKDNELYRTVSFEMHVNL